MIPVDLTNLDWHKLSEAGTSHGSLYKATLIKDGIVYYYKMSLMIGKKVVGHEAVNEVIVSRLLDILGIPHVHYTLQLAKVRINKDVLTTFVCVSQDFKGKGVSSLPLEEYLSLVGSEDTPYNALVKMGFQSYLDQLFIVDFLTINRDRHGYNTEVLFSNDVVSLAPIFDTGSSFVAPLQDDLNLICAFDPMQDVITNNFIGTESLFDNLKLISHPLYTPPLTERDKKRIFYQLSLAVSKEHLNKIWKIIWTRYSYLKTNGYLCERAEETMNFFD